MYEKHFGLTSRPFGSKAEGSNVFVGPEHAKWVTSLQKGLGASDAIVTVTGPAGVGKTTIVNRALDTLPTGRTAARIGRMHLSPQEVIDLLMAGFGIKKNHQGAIRRYAAFRRLLQAQSDNGIPVAIVIEDAQRLGAEALAEVEALTAADAGDSASANIILMGQPGLHDLLSSPDLARLKQRIRLRQKIAPLSLAEVQGYLTHSIREAGGDYDKIFESRVADVVHGCTDGIPRMINTLCESVLTTAAEENLPRVTTALVRQVASDAFGYEGDSSVIVPVVEEPDDKAPEAEVTPDAATEAATDIDWESPPAVPAKEDASASQPPREIGHDIVVESGSYPGTLPSEQEQQSIDPSPATTQAADSPVDEDDGIAQDNAIPELINDTQPELPNLAGAQLDDFDNLPVLELETAARARDDLAPTAKKEEASVSPLTEANGASGDDNVAADEKGIDDPSDESYDLDAALSPEPDETNVMEGITLNVDAAAAIGTEHDDGQDESSAELALTVDEPGAEGPATEEVSPAAALEIDLPTLTDSMRLDVAAQDPTAETADNLVNNDIPDLDISAIEDAAPRPGNSDHDSDIEALEAALAAAKNGGSAAEPEIPAIPNVSGMAPGVASQDTPAKVPEITLDNVIEKQRTQNAEMDRFRDEIGSASSLEDISDVMAETLFGCEAFDEIAAGVVANPPLEEESADKGAEPSPVMLADDDMPNAANDTDGEKQKLKERRAPDRPFADAPVPAPAVPSADEIPMNESVALRIDILNKMKANAARVSENVELGDDAPRANVAKVKPGQPEPIENQINTSITQTQKTLDLSKMNKEIEEEKPQKKSGGLFSRFKKSS